MLYYKPMQDLNKNASVILNAGLTAARHAGRTVLNHIKNGMRRVEFTNPKGFVERAVNKISPNALGAYRQIKTIPVSTLKGTKAVAASVADDAARSINVPGAIHNVAGAARSVGARGLAKGLDRTAVRLRQAGERGMINLSKGYTQSSAAAAARDVADDLGNAIGGPLGGLVTGGAAYGRNLIAHPIKSIATLGANMTTGLPVGSMMAATKAYAPVLLGGGMRKPLSQLMTKYHA